MQKKYLLPILTFLFALIVISGYFKYNSSTAEAKQGQNMETEEAIKKLDSVLKGQSAILKRLDDVERQIKSRCR